MKHGISCTIISDYAYLFSEDGMHVEPSAGPSTGGSTLSTSGSNAVEHLHHGKFTLFPKNVLKHIQHNFR